MLMKKLMWTALGCVALLWSGVASAVPFHIPSDAPEPRKKSPEVDFAAALNSISGGAHTQFRGTHQGGYGWLRSAGY